MTNWKRIDRGAAALMPAKFSPIAYDEELDSF